ncbi:Ribonuclease P protein subunit p21 [Coemansia sp. RSA 1285]|nr:Ribonuclease P protein subunit p21 [Coemansia sp. RSA 1804]KAJ2679992.1 Ribonuclease P protein subunit p21 [Coemansia sp. RSA 1285]
MNFLYQSSHFFASLLRQHPTPLLEPASTGTKATTTAAAAAVTVPDTEIAIGDSNARNPMLPIARFYAKEMRQVARKSVLRLSPHIKREICKACASPLVPGVSCSTRVKGHKKGRRVVITCLYCGCQRRLIVDPHKELFVDKDIHGIIH